MNAIVSLPMTTPQTSPVHARAPMRFGRVLRAYLLEAGLEFVRCLRAPIFVVPFIVLPAPLYLLFGVVISGPAIHANPIIGNVLFIGFALFSIVGPALFGVGCAVAIERDQGLLKLKRAMPAPTGAYLLAKVLVQTAYAAIGVILVTVAAVIAGKITLSALQLATVDAILVAGTIPFCAIGLFVGTRVSGTAAPGLMNLVYLPMIYLSGLFFPLPKALASAAVIWPTFHLNRLVFRALGVPGITTGQGFVSLAVLVLATVVLGGLALRRLARVG
jgi:ABC-2 type transport system permease protein